MVEVTHKDKTKEEEKVIEEEGLVERWLSLEINTFQHLGKDKG